MRAADAARSDELPAGTRRLFPFDDTAAVPAAPPAVPADQAAPELGAVIGRLLEDGDSADLHWLTAAVGEPTLAAWLERHGARQLSRRSLAFWEVALGRRAAVAAGRALWPL